MKKEHRLPLPAFVMIAAGANTPGVEDVVVGATLHGDGSVLAVGKYTGTFDIMASY